MLPDEIKKADTTAKWWSTQEDIKNGAATPVSMVEDVLATVKRVIPSRAGSMNNSAAYAAGGTGLILGRCPVCRDNVIETSKAFTCCKKGCSCVFFKDNKFLSKMARRYC